MKIYDLYESSAFPSDKIVPLIAKEMFDTGMMVGHGSSMEDFIDEYWGEPWWDVKASYKEILASKEFQKGFIDWLYLRYNFVINEFDKDVESAGGWPLSLIRMMTVPDNWIKNINPSLSLGVFWAVYIPNFKSYSAYGGDYSSGKEISLYAKVDPSAVDWYETMRSRMDFMNGDMEMEVHLKKGAAVELVHVENEDGNAVDFQQGKYNI